MRTNVESSDFRILKPKPPLLCESVSDHSVDAAGAPRRLRPRGHSEYQVRRPLSVMTTCLVLVPLVAAICPTVPAAEKKKSNDPWSTVWVNRPGEPLLAGVSHRIYPSAKRLGERFRGGKTGEGGGYSKAYLGDDVANWNANDSFALVNKNVDRIRGRLAIKLMCGTVDPEHLAATRDFHRELSKLGIEHSYTEVPDMGHTPDAMRKSYADTWFTQHVAAMRAAGGAK